MLSGSQQHISSLENMKNEVKTALNSILSSDLFSRSSVLSNFLKYIVEETLENRSQGIKEYTIAVHALGKSSDFDPQIDAIVRIHAGRLRRLLNEYYMDLGKTDTIIIEVVKGTYIPVFRAHSNHKSTESVKNIKETIQYSRTKLTLVVLPFRNLCADNAYQFFVDGFGEELTHIFSTFQNIDVIAHHSARKYVSQPNDVRIIGSEIGVHYIITGSVKRTEKDIRVNIGLLETLNGVQIWTQTYNYELNIDNLLKIQDQIITNVCSILGGYYGLIIRKGAMTYRKNALNMTAFDAALWQYHFHMNFSQEVYLETRQILQEVVRQDPNYALGLAMLSELYLDAYSLGYPTIENPIEEAYRLAKKAIKIDPQCQHAHQQYGWVNLYMKRKQEALTYMEKSLAINPSSVSTMGAIGFGMACAGEYERAHQLLTRSLNLNPHCPWWFYLGFFLIYYSDKQYIKALEYANKIEATDVFLEPLTRAVVKLQLGLHLEARNDAETLASNFPEIKANLQTYLSTFLLDNSLINNFIEVIHKIDTK